MTDPGRPPSGNASQAVAGGLLGPVIRRDLADLNRQFLELSLDPGLAEDARFSLSPAVRRQLDECSADARSRLATCPFSLFQLAVPEGASSGALWPDGVADAHPPAPADPVNAARCDVFILLSLSVARQMAESAPLVARLAMGLTPGMEKRLCGMGPSALASLAQWPDLVRPRWPRHERFWALLATAARGHDGLSLQRAHCVGLCLLGSPPGREPAARQGGARRRSGPVRGIPC